MLPFGKSSDYQTPKQIKHLIRSNGRSLREVFSELNSATQIIYDFLFQKPFRNGLKFRNQPRLEQKQQHWRANPVKVNHVPIILSFLNLYFKSLPSAFPGLLGSHSLVRTWTGS